MMTKGGYNDYISYLFMSCFLNVYSGTSLFQPPLGQTKVAGLVRWLDFWVHY